MEEIELGIKNKSSDSYGLSILEAIHIAGDGRTALWLYIAISVPFHLSLVGISHAGLY